MAPASTKKASQPQTPDAALQAVFTTLGNLLTANTPFDRDFPEVLAMLLRKDHPLIETHAQAVRLVAAAIAVYAGIIRTAAGRALDAAIED